MNTPTNGQSVGTASPQAVTPAGSANAAGKAPLTPGELLFNYAIFGLSTMASALMVYYLIADPARLSEVWAWIRGLPILVQVGMWLLLLPWMIALWVWSLPWALAIRVIVVVGILLFTEYLVFPWKP